jgi:hypothetical protein
MLVSLVWLDKCKLYSEKINTWKWEGRAKFNISKGGDSEYREVLVVFTMKDCSDCATCTTFPQQIGPVEDNATIA